jgi:hypothetical protein
LSKKTELKVSGTQLDVSMQIKNDYNLTEFECGWWNHVTDSLVTDDCHPTVSDQSGVITCRCSHDFMGLYSQKITSYVKSANWQYFGLPT